LEWFEHSIGWWNDWFQRYDRFVLSYADYAESNGIKTLVIGGSQVAPALPVGKLPNGKSADTPYNATDLWSGLIDNIRSKFSGQILFALPYSSSINDQSYDFLNKVDAIYVEMSSSLTTSDSPSLSEIENGVTDILDKDIYKLYATYKKPIVLGIDYASIDGSASNCLNYSTSCRNYIQSEQNSLTYVDLNEQALIYQSIIEEAIQRNWIYGLVSEGYMPSVQVEDHSSSVYGKPANVVLSHYFISLGSK
jgi:hypothetical protein